MTDTYFPIMISMVEDSYYGLKGTTHIVQDVNQLPTAIAFKVIRTNIDIQAERIHILEEALRMALSGLIQYSQHGECYTPEAKIAQAEEALRWPTPLPS